MLLVGWVLLGGRFALSTVASSLIYPVALEICSRVFGPRRSHQHHFIKREGSQQNKKNAVQHILHRIVESLREHNTEIKSVQADGYRDFEIPVGLYGILIRKALWWSAG